MIKTAISIEDIHDVIAKNKEGLSPAQIKTQEEILKKVYIDGESPVKACNMDADFLTRAYSYGYSLYQKNKIKDAWRVFEWLKIMNPLQMEYYTAALHCHLQLKNWQLAINELMLLAFLNPNDPHPFAKMSECLMELDDNTGALGMMEKAIERAGDKPEYAEDKAKWKMQYEYIITLIDIDPEVLAKIRAEYAEPDKKEN